MKFKITLIVVLSFFMSSLQAQKTISGTSSVYSYNIASEKGKVYLKSTEINMISCYEEYLAKGYGIRELNKQAVSSIYKLTAEMDAVEGYRYFLNKYPNTPEAKLASNRLYEIMYAISEEENSILSYNEFLINFSKAPIQLRQNAYKNGMILEVEKSYKEFDNKKKDDDDLQLRERLARVLYVEAIQAKEAGDQYTFMRKYNTVLYSKLFKDTQAAFDLFRDKELAKLIRSLRDEIISLKYEVSQANRALLNKLDVVIANQQAINSQMSSQSNSQSKYLQRIADISSKQANDWSNYVSKGIKPTGIFGSPNVY